MIDIIGAGGSPNLYLPVPVEAGHLSREIALPDEDPAGIHNRAELLRPYVTRGIDADTPTRHRF